MAVFFTEIIIPILEGRKNIPWYQRHSLMKSLCKTFGESGAEGGQMLVEIYLNYDCDVEATAKENIWERLMNALSKVTSQHVDASTQSAPLIQFFLNQGSGTPALTTNNLVLLNSQQVKELFSVSGDAGELRKQGVALMGSAILKPMMEWLSERILKLEQQKVEPKGEEEGRGSDPTLKDESIPIQKPLSLDDPTAIGYLKLRKQQLIEGIKKFNAKPKKVLPL